MHGNFYKIKISMHEATHNPFLGEYDRNSNLFSFLLETYFLNLYFGTFIISLKQFLKVSRRNS